MENSERKEWFEVFAHNVRWLRRQYGLSKKQMARMLGIGVESLNKIEQGQLPPSLSVDVLLNIHRNFRIRPDAMLRQRMED